MIFEFLQKQKDKKKKKHLVQIMISSMNIYEEEKDLYLEGLDRLDEQALETLYTDLSSFVENIELKNIEDIEKENFSQIAGMRKIDAEEKKKNLNSFNFLLNNF